MEKIIGLTGEYNEVGQYILECFSE